MKNAILHNFQRLPGLNLTENSVIERLFVDMN